MQTESIFRLCQEAVTNAIRHGNAKNIHIILRFKEDEIEIIAIDNGIGCVQVQKSYGLEGIERRIHHLAGKVIFGFDGNKGFSIHAKIPKTYIEA